MPQVVANNLSKPQPYSSYSQLKRFPVLNPPTTFHPSLITHIYAIEFAESKLSHKHTKRSNVEHKMTHFGTQAASIQANTALKWIHIGFGTVRDMYRKCAMRGWKMCDDVKT